MNKQAVTREVNQQVTAMENRVFESVTKAVLGKFMGIIDGKFRSYEEKHRKEMDDIIEVHEKNCIAEKCSVPRISSSVPPEMDLCTEIEKKAPECAESSNNELTREQLELISILTRFAPDGTILDPRDKLVYSCQGLARQCRFSDSLIRTMLNSLVEQGIVAKRSVHYGNQYGIAYWKKNGSKEGIESGPTSVKLPLNSAEVFKVLPGAFDTSLRCVPGGDPHTAAGVAARLGHDNPAGISKVGQILQDLIEHKSVSRQAVEVIISNGAHKPGWVYWKKAGRA
jgi:hypothetical protein